MQTFAFAAHDNSGRGCVIHFGVGFLAVFVEADKPVACLFEFFHCPYEIGDFGDGKVRQSSGGRTRDRIREARRTALRDDHAMHASGQRGTDDGAEIVRIFDAVEQNDQPLATFRMVGAVENVVEGGGRSRGGDSDDPLVVPRVGQTIELPAILETDGDAAFAREFHDAFDAGILTALGDDDAIECASGFEGFADGVNTGETVHGKKSTVESSK